MDELSQMVRDSMSGIKDELKAMLPSFDLSPDIPDNKIKQAILDLSPEGMQTLFNQFGQAEVIKFINDFSRRRKF